VVTTENHPSGLLTCGQVADLYGVDRKTAVRWAEQGVLGEFIKTPGGHRRFRADVIHALRAGKPLPPPASTEQELLARELVTALLRTGMSPAGLVDALQKVRSS
jgi:excisionase family DNA binding protein